jgi:hypothetical protein
VLVVDGTSQYLTGSRALVPGGARIAVSWRVASLLPGGSSVVIARSTLALNALTGARQTTTSEVEYIIGSQTLRPDGAAIVTISGSAVQASLQAGGSNVVVGGTTTMLANMLVIEGAKSTEVLVTATGVGGIIASIGGLLTSESTSQPPYVLVPAASAIVGFNGSTFTGAASAVPRREDVWVIWWGLLLGFGAIVVVLM